MAEFHTASPPTSNPQRRPPTPEQTARRTQIKLIVITLIAIVLIFTTLGALGYFGTHEGLLITQVNFNFSCPSSQVLFSLTNNGPVDVTVTQVEVSLSGVPGQLSTTQLASNVLPKGTLTTLTAFFPGLAFTGGAVYTFTLVTSHGSSFSSAAVVPTVLVTEQLSIDQVAFDGGSQVTFALSNPGTCDVSVASATVRGASINGTASGRLLSGGYVPGGSTSSSLVVSFSGVTFQSGSRYTFALTSARGNRFQAQAYA